MAIVKALTEHKRSLYEEINRLQGFRFRLISVYFLVLGGAGFFVQAAPDRINLRAAVEFEIFWLYLGFAVLSLVTLGLLMARRAAEYTNIIRVNLNNIDKIDKSIFYSLQIKLVLTPHPKTPYNEEWSKRLRDWPVEVLLLPIMSIALTWGMSTLFAVYYLKLALSCSFVLSFLPAVVVLWIGSLYISRSR